MIRAVDNASVLALAQYANEKLAPLMEKLDQGSLSIVMNLGVPYFGRHDSQWSIQITVKEHQYVDVHGDYIILGTLIVDSEEVDNRVRAVESHLAKLRLAA